MNHVLLVPAAASLGCVIITAYHLRVLYTELSSTRDMLIALATLVIACSGVVLFTILALLP